MGIEKRYNPHTKKWEWKGFMFVMEFDTEEECDAARSVAWEKHMNRLEVFSMVNRMLIPLRYK